MPEETKPNVRIRLDGLFLFCFNKKEKQCEVKVHTAAEGHVLQIKVKASGRGGGIIYDETFSREKIKDFGQISIGVVRGNEMRPLKNSAVPKDSYDQILDLEGGDFYGHPLEIKRGKYGVSIYLNHGEVEAGVVGTCWRVKEPLFATLNFERTTPTAWKKMVREAQVGDKHSVMELQPFASDVLANIGLKQGQRLRLTQGRKMVDLFPPLGPGKKYQIGITYLDKKTPMSLAECEGFAHHCMAFKLKKSEPIYGIFDPPFPTEDVTGETPPSCCRCGRISLP